MRRYDSKGMDGPWAFKNGVTCVGNGESVEIPINNGTVLPSDVDDVKAVIWWYDKRHESSNSLDDIDLELWSGSNRVAFSNDDYDNKERVYNAFMGGTVAKLEIVGQNVTSDVAGCGANKMKVWWAWFYEDDDRDDSDGPSLSQIERE